jgi:hypothetical protein
MCSERRVGAAAAKELPSVPGTDFRQSSCTSTMQPSVFARSRQSLLALPSLQGLTAPYCSCWWLCHIHSAATMESRIMIWN